MTFQRTFKFEWLRFRGCLARNGNHGLEIFDLPDPGCMIGTTGCEMLDIRGEENSGDILVVGFEVGDGHELSFLAVLEEMPDEDIAL
jgi:hypothetical protein